MAGWRKAWVLKTAEFTEGTVETEGSVDGVNHIVVNDAEANTEKR